MILFFGWGRNAKRHQLSPQQVLLLRYTYVHVLWAFRISVPQGYAVASLTPQGWATQPVSNDEARYYGFTERLTLHWWWRWGLVVPVALLAIMMATSAITAP